jgi:CheY-like chemotaxis protein
MGFEVIAHEYPAQALAAVKTSKPDLLITDLNMPEMSGLQLSEEIRKLYKSDALPILMVTTQSDVVGQAISAKASDTEGVVQRAGIDLVLNKPFQPADLQNALAQLLKSVSVPA